MHCNPMQQMIMEHDMGRALVAQMEKGLKENNIDEILEGAEGYANLLQDHIYKEENMLYPMADEALSSEVKEKMLEKFLQVQNEFSKENDEYLLFVNSSSD